MGYSSLAVHCTSLCCDLMQNENFISLSHDDINLLYEDVYCLLRERTELWPERYPKEHEFIHSVTLGVLKALHYCLDSSAARNPTWLLEAMQSRISATFKRLYKNTKVRRRYFGNTQALLAKPHEVAG